MFSQAAASGHRTKASPMLQSMLTPLLEYHSWASQRYAGWLDDMPESWLDQPCSGSFHSLRATALHMADAERIWLERLQGQSAKGWPSQRPGAETDPLSTYLQRSTGDFVRHVGAQADAWFAAWCTFADLSGRRHRMEHSGIVQHVVNHSSFHRGQLVVQARAIADLASSGQAPAGELPPIPGSDYITWMRAQQPSHPDSDPELKAVYGA